MVLKTFVLLISALSFASTQQMTCMYSFSPPSDYNRYQCDLSINNPNGYDDAVSIGGVHLVSYIDPYGNQISTDNNDSSVKIVRIVGTTNNIPSAICNQFPNAEVLQFSNSNIELFSTTKCSKATNLELSYNLIEGVLTDICKFQPALKVIKINYNYRLKFISNVALNSCKNLQVLNIEHNQISSIGSSFFANTPIIQTINIGGNLISDIPYGLFNGLTELSTITMHDSLITDLPLNIFSTNNKLNFLAIGNNRFTQFKFEWSQNLKNLTELWLNFNKVPISSDFFKSMTMLKRVNLENCNISVVDPQWFSTLTSLIQLRLYNNNIADIPNDTFTATKALKDIDIRNNKLKTIRSKWFSNASLQGIVNFNADDNEVNAIDPLFFEQATRLNEFSLSNNTCYNGTTIEDFLANRSSYIPGFKTCLDNFAAV